MGRRLTALLFALCMVFSMLCNSAWADWEAADGAGNDAPGSVEAVEPRVVRLRFLFPCRSESKSVA